MKKFAFLSLVLFLGIVGFAHAQSSNPGATPTYCREGYTPDGKGGCMVIPATNPSTTGTNQPNPNAFCAGGKCTYTPLEPLPGLPQTFGGKDSFATIAGGSIKIFIWLGATVAVVMLIIGALTYMFSDIVGNKTKALSRIRGAMWAILLLASSWIILNSINPQLVNFNLNINPIASVQSPTAANASPLSSLTQADIQARQNSCNSQCSFTGGSLRIQPDNTLSCICTSP